MWNTNLEQAKRILWEEGCTCVLCKEGETYRSTERGVKPLLGWLDTHTDLMGCAAADKVVGKASAYLYVLLQVEAVYAPVMSQGAFEILEQYGIKAFFEEKPEEIRNRMGTGQCPMEEAVGDARTPEEAREAITARLMAMRG